MKLGIILINKCWIVVCKQQTMVCCKRERFQTLKEELKKVYAEEKMMEEDLMKEFAEKSVNTLPVFECPKTYVPPALAAMDEVYIRRRRLKLCGRGAWLGA